MSTRAAADASSHPGAGRGPVAWRPVLLAGAAAGLLLTALSGGYGYHRDELYFRMLPPGWGYVDQPPLTPWLARISSEVVADEVWALRLAATAATVCTVVVIALLTRELGGGRLAQTASAWGYAGAASTLMFGHVLLPATLDLLLWAAIALAAARAALHDPRWWLVAGSLIGLTTSNRWLVAVLAVGIALGVLLTGPRSALRSPWLWAGAGAALLLTVPNLVFQAMNGWPQLAMGAALGDNNAAEVRTQMWLLLVLLLGPPLVPVWLWGIAHLVSARELRTARFLVVAFVVVLAFTFVSGAQAHYFIGLLTVLFAAGCVPLGRLLEHRPRWRPWVGAVIALNGVVSTVLALPVLPETVLARTPVPDISPLVADQVGWPRYVEQVGAAYQQALELDGGLPPDQVAVITSNYGEAGAIARYGAEHGLPDPLSGHNHLHGLARPADSVRVVVLVGGQSRTVSEHFETCREVDELDNGTGVDNEEQGQPIMVCEGPEEPWGQLWPRFAHLD